MTLDQAIKTLKSIKKVCTGLFPPDEQTAVSLGIEALKRIQQYRTDRRLPLSILLSGETED